jgi:hypothetical protein
MKTSSPLFGVTSCYFRRKSSNPNRINKSEVDLPAMKPATAGDEDHNMRSAEPKLAALIG